MLSACSVLPAAPAVERCRWDLGRVIPRAGWLAMNEFEWNESDDPDASFLVQIESYFDA
jgi:hypothetical protein